MEDSDTVGAVGQRWKHRFDGYTVLLEGWIPGVRGWSATRTGSSRTDLVRDCDLSTHYLPSARRHREIDRR